MNDLLGLDEESLPLIWDADFLYGPKSESGDDSYVLCEINTSCAWPYPPRAHRPIANVAIGKQRSVRS
jgi:hypothetical protein